MALARYSDTFWYPSGILAASIPANVFPRGSSVHAQLWADAAGTVPLPNPLTTSPSGVLTFYATIGEYWVHIDQETFLVDVGMSQEQADLSTGIASGGDISPSATLASIDITPLIGYVVSFTTDGSAPTIVKVDSPQRTETLVGPSLTRVLTWWLMDSAGVVSQQATRPTNTQRRTHLILGLTAWDGSTNIVFDQTLPVTLPQPINQLVDLMAALGPFNIVGNNLSVIPGTLQLNKTEGSVFSHSFNYVPNYLDPHVTFLPAQAPMQFMYNTQLAFSDGPVVATVDPANYDVGGVVTPVPSSTDFTIQRVWGFPLNNILQQIRIQYGQNFYPDMQSAENAVGNTTFIPNPEGDPFGALLAHLVVRADATDLSDPTQAALFRASKFATP